MAWFIGQSLLIIVAAFLLGILVGWLIWGARWRRDGPAAADDDAQAPAEPEPRPALHSEAATAPLETVPAVPAARSAGHDDDDMAAVAASHGDTDSDDAGGAARLAPAAADSGSLTAGEAVVASAATLVAEPEQVSALEPELEEEPVDDLDRIEGIGPQMAAALVRAGIRTYAELAAADETTLRDAIEARGLRFAPSLVTWAQQAQLLADGDEEGFADLTRRLVAGRDEGRQ